MRLWDWDRRGVRGDGGCITGAALWDGPRFRNGDVACAAVRHLGWMLSRRVLVSDNHRLVRCKGRFGSPESVCVAVCFIDACIRSPTGT